MGKTLNEFCRICENSRSVGGSFICTAASMQEQWQYVSRGWCAKGKVAGINMKFISHSYIETKDRRYSRRGSEKDDVDLTKALFAGGEILERFEIPFSILRLSAGKNYREF